MATIGFLHTADVHVPTFRGLLRELAPSAVDIHVVDAELLADARRGGVDDELRARLRDRLEQLEREGVDLTVCTCSTLSGEAEALAAGLSMPVLRIDRPMAEAAVGHGGRIAVVAALASTLGPTRALLEQAAASAGVELTVVEAVCPDSWASLEAGDQVGYLDRLTQRVQEVVAHGNIDVVVLAQASMAPLADRVTGIGVPVLSSPRLAVERAVAVVHAVSD